MQRQGRDALRLSKPLKTPEGRSYDRRFGVFSTLSSSLKTSFKAVTSTMLRRKAVLVTAALIVPGIVLFSALKPSIPVATAAPSTYLNFQARLMASAGNLVPDGTYNIEFKLYNAASSSGSSQGSCTGDANCVWTETRVSGDKVNVVNGYMSVTLGSVTAFGGSIDWSQQHWLTMNIGGTGSPGWDGEMTPRIQLTAVPLAFVANNVASGGTNAVSTNSDNVSIQSGNAAGATSNSGNITIDAGTATGTTGTISLGASNASSLILGRSGLTTLNAGNMTIQGGTATFGTTSQAGSLVVSDGSSSTITIKSASQVAATNYDLTIPAITANDTICLLSLGNCFGSGSGGTLQAAYDADVDGSDAVITLTATDGAIVVRDASSTIGNLFVVEANGGTDYLSVSSTAIGLGLDTTLAAGKSLTVTGGNTASRPGSPTEGMVYFDTDTKQLLTYANGKWQSDRSPASRIVAANDSSQTAKDSADYVADNTSDQTEINNAITAVNGEGGGVVYLLEGTYTIDGSILLMSDVTLAGSGEAATIITVPNSQSTALDMLAESTNPTNVVVRNLTIDGNDANATGDIHGIYLTGVGTSSTNGVLIDGVTIANTKLSALLLPVGTSSYNVTVQNSTIRGSGGTVDTDSAIYVYGTSDFVLRSSTLSGNSTAPTIYIRSAGAVINGNRIVSNGGIGISVHGTGSGGVISNNTINNNTGIGIDSGGTEFTITGNSVISNSGGIRLNGQRSVVSGNAIRSNTGSGISMDSSSSYNLVTNNTLYDNGGSGSTSSINNIGTANRIIGNTIIDTAGTGYAIVAGGTGTYLADNNYSGTGATSINDTGTGTRYASQMSAAQILQSSSSYIRANATNVITGSIDPIASTTVTGVGTKFLTELQVGDRITMNTETRTVTAIASDASLTVDVATTDTANDTTIDRLPQAFRVSDSSGTTTTGLIVNDIGAVGINTLYPSSSASLTVGNSGSSHANIRLMDTNTTQYTDFFGNYDGGSSNDEFLIQVVGNAGTGSFMFTDEGDFGISINPLQVIPAHFAVIGNADEVQMLARGHSTQTSDLFQLQDSNGLINSAFNGAGNQLTLGRVAASGVVTQGKLILSDGTTDNFSLTLQSTTLSGSSKTITFPNETGTVCTTATVCTGYGAASGSFVNLQGSTPGTQQTGHLNISGTGIFGGNVTVTSDTTTGRLAVNGSAFGTVEIFRVNTPTTVDNSAVATISTGATTSKGLVIQGVASQTANLQEWQSSGGTILGRVNQVGGLIFSANAQSSFGTSSPATNTILTVSTNSLANAGIVIKGVASQSGDLLQLQDNAGLINGSFNSTGAQLTLGRIAASGTVTQGKLLFSDGTTDNLSLTLQSTTLTSTSKTITFPDATGTVCLTTGNCSGVGGTGDILNNGQNGSVRIGSNDTNSTILESNNVDRLTITSAGNATFTNGSTGDALTVNNSTSTGNILTLQDNGTGVLSVADGGAITLQNSVDSTAALVIYNAAGTDVLRVDTSTTVNLISNPGFAQNTTGWAALGAAGIARNTANYMHDRASLALTTTAAANDGVKFPYSFPSSTNGFNISFYAKLSTGTMSTFEVGRSDDGATFTSCGTFSLTTTWTRFKCNKFTTGTVSGSPFIYFRQTDATARTIYIDSVQMEQLSIGVWSAYNGSGLIRADAPFRGGISIQQVDDTENNGLTIYAQSDDGQQFSLYRNSVSRSVIDAGHYLDILGYDNEFVLQTGSGATYGGFTAATPVFRGGAVAISRASGYNALNVVGSSGQTSDLIQLRDSSNNVNALFNSTGAQLTLGRVAASGTVTQGKLLFSDGTTDNLSLTLQSATLTSTSKTITFPDATGTVCLTTGNCSGVGGTGDILNNGQNGSVRIGSNDTNSTILESNNVDRLTITSGGNATYAGGTTGDAFTISNSTSTGSILTLQDNATSVLTVADGGGVLFKNSADSTSAFTIQNLSGTALFNVDTTNSVIKIAQDSWFAGVDGAGTGTINILKVNANNEIQFGAALNVDGGIVFPTNAGQITFTDLPIDGTATAGTKESYSLRVGSSNVLTVYGEADGSGNAQNLRVAIGSSISPAYTLDVGGTLGVSGAATFGVASSATGTALFRNASGSGGITLTPANPSASSYTITLPAETGTVCTTATVCSGYGAASGSFVNLQGSTPGTPQTGHLNISGTGIFGGDVTASGNLTVDTNTLFVDATNNRVGIGTTTTTDNILTVTGTAPNVTDGSIVSSVGTLTSATNFQNNIYVDTTVTPSGASTSSFTGIYNSITTASNNLSGAGGNITGLISGATYTGSGTLDTALGAGVQVTNFGTGTIVNATALTVSNILNFGGGSVTNAVGIALGDTTVGTSKNTNLLIGATQPAGNWSIYNASAYDNAFAGNLRVGSTTAPTVALDVTGAAIISSTLAVQGASITSGTTAQAGSLIVSDGSSSTITLKTATQVAATNYDISVPAITASDTICLVALANCSGGSGANTALSNLASVAINTSLLPATDDSIDLGDNTHRFRDAYLGGETLHIGTSTSDEGAIGYTTATNILGFSSTGGLDFTAGSTGDYLFNADNDSTLQVTGTVTDDGAAQIINVTLGDDLNADIVAGLTINATSVNTGEADNLFGLLINDLVSPSVSPYEIGLVIGSGWDANLAFVDTTTIIQLSDTGYIDFQDDSGNTLLKVTDVGSTGDVGISGILTVDAGILTPIVDSTVSLELGTIYALSVTIGNTTNTTSIALQGAAAATYTIGNTNTTGIITVGQSTATNTIRIGSANGSSATQTINIGAGNSATSGGKVINIGTGVPGTGTTNTISIGNGGTTTGTVGITIGSNGAAAHTTLIQGGNGTGASAAIKIQPSNAGQINIGGTSQTGGIIVGQSTLDQTVVIANGNGTNSTQTVNINTGSSSTSGGKIVNIATGTPGSGTTTAIAIGNGGSTLGTVGITIGSVGAAAHTTLIQGGTGSTALQLQVATTGDIVIGNTSHTGTITVGKSTVSNTISIGSANGSGATQTINLGAGTSATSGGKVINIGTGIPGASTTNTIAIGNGGTTTGTVGITIGSNGAAGHTTLIQGGNGATALQLQVASGGTLSVGNGGVASTLQIGNTTGAVVQTINIGNNATASSATNIELGSSIGASSTTIQSGSGNIKLQGANSVVFSGMGSDITTVSNQDFRIGPNGSGNVLIGSSDTTGTLFVVDTKTSAGDTTGVDGGIYYNSNAGKFRCYQASAWTDCIGGGGGVTTVGTIDTPTTSADGAHISGSTIYLQSATASVPGLVNTGTQTFAGVKTFNGSVVLAASQSLTVTGGNTASRPGSPTEGMIYFDTTTKQLLTYANGKWQQDRTDAVLVAASNSSQSDKDAADYVADGDGGGANDGDQVQINSALTAGSGKKVVLLAGTYVADATILIPNNTTLTGVGNGTVIELANLDATENLIENSDVTTGTGITIRDMTLDGRNDLNTTGIQTGIYLNSASNGRIDNIVAQDFRNGSLALDDASSHNNITGFNSTSNTDYDGIVIETSSNYNTISSSYVAGSGGNGIMIYDSEHNTITGNTFGGSNVGASIRLESATYFNTVTGNTILGGASNFGIVLAASAAGNTVTGNSIYSQASVGIIVSGNDNIVNGNYIEDAPIGISIDSANDNLVQGNTVMWTGSTTAFEGIKLTTADSNKIVNNNLWDDSCSTTCYAINVSNAGSDNNYLSGNVFNASAGTATINNSGTGTTYANQSVAENGLNTLFKQANSTSAFSIQNASGVNFLNVDTTNSNITVGASDTTGTLLVLDTKTGSGDPTGVNGGMYYNSNDGKFRCYEGSAWKNCLGVNSVRDTLAPEFPGATLTGDGSSNTGTMTSDFCSGSSWRNIPSASNPCAATEEHNYYSWTSASGTNDYDVWIRYQVPSDYSSFTSLNAYGWRTTGSSSAQVLWYKGATQCNTAATTVSTSNTTWTETSVPNNSCTLAANDVLTIRITLSAAASEFARIGEIRFDYAR